MQKGALYLSLQVALIENRLENPELLHCCHPFLPSLISRCLQGILDLSRMS